MRFSYQLIRSNAQVHGANHVRNVTMQTHMNIVWFVGIILLFDRAIFVVFLPDAINSIHVRAHVECQYHVNSLRYSQEKLLYTLNSIFSHSLFVLLTDVATIVKSTVCEYAAVCRGKFIESISKLNAHSFYPCFLFIVLLIFFLMCICCW